MKNIAWQAIFEKYAIFEHDFDKSPFKISADQIKNATSHFSKTGQREVRILCKQDERKDRPLVFEQRELFILPVRNGEYVIVKGEGYIDIPPIKETTKIYSSKLEFPLITSTIGSSEMQHLDYAFATSIIRTFIDDPTLVLTIRGRKYTPRFTLNVGKHSIIVESVQTEVDGGYEGSNQIVLVEAKNSSTTNTIIRQLYYPFRQWSQNIKLKGINKLVYTIFVSSQNVGANPCGRPDGQGQALPLPRIIEKIPIFFEKRENKYKLWQFNFIDEFNYNSIQLLRSQEYQVIE